MLLPSSLMLRVHSLGWPLMTLDFVGGAGKLSALTHKYTQPLPRDGTLAVAQLCQCHLPLYNGVVNSSYSTTLPCGRNESVSARPGVETHCGKCCARPVFLLV